MGAFSFDVVKYSELQASLTLPLLDPKLISDLFVQAGNIFKNEQNLVDVRSPCIVIGDLHGQILDLIRILNMYGMPNRKKYVFLGDLVDRGEFSIEVLIIVLLLKVLYPDQVTLIRGNHEFEFLSSQCGFMQQIGDTYGNVTLFNLAMSTFSFIPMACRIDRKYLCVHGGIGPQLKSLNQIVVIKRPVAEFGDPVIDSLMWSDPSDDLENFVESDRGAGSFFGEKALTTFLNQNQITMLIRGHECVMSGCEFHFNNKLVTVFSASNYCGMVNNQGGVLEINGPEYKARLFPPLKWLMRINVTYQSKESKKLKQPPSRKKMPTSMPSRNLTHAASTKNLPNSKAHIITDSESEMTSSYKHLPKLDVASISSSDGRPASRAKAVSSSHPESVRRKRKY